MMNVKGPLVTIVVILVVVGLVWGIFVGLF